MSYQSKELSIFGGAPIEIYRFYQGVNIWRYTSADKEVIYNGEKYTPIPISRTGIDQSKELKAGSIDITVPRDNPLAGKYIATNPASAVWLTILRYHRADDNARVIFIGRVTNVKFQGSRATISVSPIQDIVDRMVPRITFQGICNHILYSPYCGIAPDAYRVNAILEAVNQEDLVSNVFSSKPNGWFNNGYVVLGDQYRMIVSHSGNTVKLLAPLEKAYAGLVVFAYAGCDRSRQTCIDKFNNLTNYLAWNYIPSKNPFDVGVT